MTECQYQKILNCLSENNATKLEEILSNINISKWNCLHFAAAYENLDLARTILAKSKDGLNAPDELNRTPLTVASSKGNLQLVQLFHEHGAEIGFALHYACSKMHRKCVSYLLRNGADVNLRDAKSYSPLIVACARGDLDTARMLIEHGADINGADYQGSTALHWACESPSIELVQLLISRGADVNAEDAYKFTPLLCALIRNEDWPEIVRVLLQNGAKYKDDVITSSSNARATLELLQHGCCVDGVDGCDNESALFNCAFQNQTELARVLLERKAQPDLATRGGWTALHVASKLGNGEFVDLLLRHGAKVNCASSYNVLPIHLAAFEGHLDTVRRLLRAGSYVSVASLSMGVGNLPFFVSEDVIQGRTPLFLAAFQGHSEIAKLLLEHGAGIDEIDGLPSKEAFSSFSKTRTNSEQHDELNGFTPLHYAALTGNAVDLNSPFLNTEDNFKRTPLSIAAARGNASVVKALAPLVDLTKGLPLHYAIESGSAESIRELIITKYPELVNVEDSSKRTPLLLATAKNNLEAVELLLANGADPNHANEWQETALHLCKQPELCLTLLKHGAKVDAVTTYEDTPLLSSHSNHEVMKILLEHGADVNARDKILWTSLHSACHNASMDCVQVLLQHGADVFALNDENETPLYLSSDDARVMKALLDSLDEDAAKKLVNVCADGGWSPLHMAVRDGNLQCVRELLSRGAEVNSASADNVFPVYLAAFYGHTDILESLIKAGSCLNVPVNDVGVVNLIANSSKNLKCVKYGFTPLMAAVFAGKLDAVQVLVSSGAALDMEDLEGNTAVKLAVERGYTEIAEFLVDNGAKEE